MAIEDLGGIRPAFVRIARCLAGFILIFEVAVGSFLPAQVSAAEIDATDWRAADRDDGTRLVVELSDQVHFALSGEAEPLRLLVDLPGVTPKLPGKLAAVGLIRGVEIERKGDRTRLAVSLSRPVKIAQSFMLEPSEGKPYRLVIDLAPASRAAFVDALVPKPPERKPEPKLAAKPVETPPAPRPITASPPPIAASAEPPPPLPGSALPAEPPAPPPVAVVPTPIAAPVETPPAPALPAPVPPPPAIAPTPKPAFSAPAVSEQPSASQTIREPGKPVTVIVPIKPQEPPPDSKPAPAQSATSSDSRIVIALDPGHGGVDPGATGRDGVHEKAITLATAQAVKQALEEDGRYQVVLTREDDSFVRLRQRVALARQAGAQLFVSIHADVLANRSIAGLSVYTLSDTATDREAEALAAKENKADVIAGVDLSASTPEVSTILIDLAQRETNTLSDLLAERLVKEISGIAPELPKAHRSAGFAVLTAPDIPSVLIELGYLSNEQEAKRLESVEERKRLARAIGRAIDRYLQARMLQRS
jgi:N-acetylmuramoyl-L-alanine amidase